MVYLNKCINYKHPLHGTDVGSLNWSASNAVFNGLNEYNNYLRGEGCIFLPTQPEFSTVITQCKNSGLTQPFNCDDLPSEKNHREMLAILDKTMDAV